MASSLVTIIPPPPVVISLFPLKLRQATSPSVPTIAPLYLAPRLSVASSMTTRPYRRASSSSGSMSTGWPRMWTGMIALTRRPVTRLCTTPPADSHCDSKKSFNRDTSIWKYLGSASMNTGHAPTYRMAFTGEMNVRVDTITSSSASTPATIRAMCNAAVPFTVAIACVVPTYSVIARSNRPTNWPTDDTKFVRMHSSM